MCALWFFLDKKLFLLLFMFLFLCESHIQIVISLSNYTNRFHKFSFKRFLHHKKRKFSYTHCYLKHNFYRLNMFCTCYHCKQRFLVLLSRLFLSVHQTGLSLAHSLRSNHHQLSLIPLPRCPQTEIVYTPYLLVLSGWCCLFSTLTTRLLAR